MAWHRLFPDPLTQGHRAYDRGDWDVAAQSGREVLKSRNGDPGALRLLARSSIKLGRDDAALGIYTRRLEASAFQAEDYLLLGAVLKRRGRDDGAIWAWNKALETEPLPVPDSRRPHPAFLRRGGQEREPRELEAASPGFSGTGGRAAPPATGLGVSGRHDPWPRLRRQP